MNEAKALKPLRSTAPSHSLLNPSKQYVASDKTDLRSTFARIKREQAEAKRQIGRTA